MKILVTKIYGINRMGSSPKKAEHPVYSVEIDALPRVGDEWAVVMYSSPKSKEEKLLHVMFKVASVWTTWIPAGVYKHNITLSTREEAAVLDGYNFPRSWKKMTNETSD